MVLSGLGITVVPRSSVDNRSDEATQLVSRPLTAPAPSRRIALVWRKSFPRAKAVSVLREAILGSGMRGVSFLKK